MLTDTGKTMEEKYVLTGMVPDPTKTELTFTRFFQMAERYPDNVALSYLGLNITYKKLVSDIDRFAAALTKLGVGHGDRVMLYLSNCPQWVIANFAIQRLGAAVVPVSPIYTAHELEYLVNDAGVEVVICQDTNFGYVHEVLDVTCLEQIIVTNLTEMLPIWKVWLGHLLDTIPNGTVPTGLHIHSFGKLLAQAPAKPPAVEIDPYNDLAYIMYTGGTTGFPKGVAGNHATEVGYINDVMSEVLEGNIKEGDDTVLMVNPLYHIMAKGFLIAAGLNYGCKTVLMPVPHIDALLRDIERHGVRWFLGVPALYRMILENDRLDQYDLSSLTYCYCGGDVLPSEVFKRWRVLTGSPIYQVYGSTEVGHVAYTRPNVEPQHDVIGHVLPSYRARITDPETLEPVGQGEVGELWVYADYTIKSYWNKPDETALSYVEVDGKTYYRMGDFVVEDGSGQIRFMERTADVIKYKGYRVSASEIEAALQDHPTVIGACAVGIEDSAVGERIKAIVVLKHDAKGVSGSDLRKWCKERLAPYKVPQYIEFRDMLPKSKVGKLLRRSIRDEERRKAAGT
jgi:long-chain acyl-CoA synthetase